MSAQPVERVPMKGWITTFAGTTINLCLGILYAWSIWKKALVNVDKAGEVMTGTNAGWTYLTNAQAATPFAICVVLFALLMIPAAGFKTNSVPKWAPPWEVFSWRQAVSSLA
jgi:OFA family oxalate/formate antiporter-like MFS transporter